MKFKSVGPLVCLLLVLVTPIISGFKISLHSQLQPADSYEDYQEIQMLPDPELDGSYLTFENDNHNAFESNSLISEVELLWSHINGVELDFREPSDITNNLPNCEEYVYISESFTWDYNVLPTQVSAYLEYEVNLIGDFDSISWPVLFSVYVWLIDSSGEWTRIYSSYSGMPSSQVSVNIGVSYDVVSRAWGGMIENDYGVQTDPTDTLRFAVGLAPTYAFAEDENQYWNWMNGVVQVLVDSMSLTCIVNPTPDDEVTLIPDYVRTRGTTSDDISFNLAFTEAGTIYTIGVSYSEITSMTLTKWTSVEAESLTRSIHGEDSWRGFGIAVSESEVVAVGSAMINNQTDTLIAKWNHQGILLWNKTFDLGDTDCGHNVEIADNGSIFVMGSYYEGIASTTYLAKFTNDGTLLWSKNVGYPFGDYPCDIGVDSDGYVYTATRLRIAKWDFDGIQIWNRTGIFSSVKVTREGNLYTTNLITPRNLLQQWNSDGTKGWNLTLTYNHTFAGETYLYPVLLDVNPAGWVYVKLISARGIGKFILAIYDTEGVQLWNQTMDPEYVGHPYYHWFGNVAGVHSSGFVCFSPSIVTTRGDLDLCLQLYLTDSAPPIISSTLTIALIVIAVVIILAITPDFIRRRRSFREDEETIDWMTTQVYLASRV